MESDSERKSKQSLLQGHEGNNELKRMHTIRAVTETTGDANITCCT